MNPTQSYRDRQYLILHGRTPKNRLGKPICHLCGQRAATQQHERINRYQTPEKSAARVLSYKATLCSYLCQECHDVAEVIENEQKLWEYSAKLFGRDAVLRDLQTVIDAHLPSKLTYHLPEEWTHGKRP